jgi:4-hydroxy-4-methyl-2-oxoglutarate aldolase
MYEVNVNIDRPSAALVERYRSVWVEAVVQSQENQSMLVDPLIKPIAARDWKICGPAVTVALDEADTLMPMVATAVAKPGDVVVVAAGGDCSRAVWGNGLTISARNMRCEGAIVDGAVLDSSAISRQQMPVYGRMATLNHSVGSKVGSVNVDVIFGGVPVSPGDLVLGDMDGLVIVPRLQMQKVIVSAETLTAKLEAAKASLKPGVTLFDLRGGRPMLENLGVCWRED